MNPATQSGAQSQVGISSGWSPLLETATREVFELMLATPLTPMPSTAPISGQGLTAMVGLAGRLCGVVSIACTSSAASRMASKMLGVETNGVDESVRDAMGEICNMVAGGFKSKVVELERDCNLSVPTVITGADFHLQSLAEGERLEISLGFEGEPIRVAIDFHTEALALKPGVFRKPAPTPAPEPEAGQAGPGHPSEQPVAGGTDMSTATSNNGQAGSPTNGEWAPLLETATREVFQLMLETQLERGGDAVPATGGDLTAMVGLAGQLCGVLSMRCGADSASRMAAKMLGVEAIGADDSIRDAVGEISNMIAGNFKAKVAGLRENCSLSVPTVVSGSDYECHPLADGERVEVSLQFEGAPLWVALDFHQ